MAYMMDPEAYVHMKEHVPPPPAPGEPIAYIPTWLGTKPITSPEEAVPGTEIAQAGIGLPMLLSILSGLLGGGVMGGVTGAFEEVTAEAYSKDYLGGVDMGNGGIPTALGVVNGVSVAGPGVPEPPRGMVAKQWSVAVHSNTYGTFRMFYFKLIDGRIMCYNPSTRGWKIWRSKKPLAVMYRGKTTLSQAVKVQKYLDRLWRTVAKKTKAVKLA